MCSCLRSWSRWKDLLITSNTCLSKRRSRSSCPPKLQTRSSLVSSGLSFWDNGCWKSAVLERQCVQTAKVLEYAGSSPHYSARELLGNYGIPSVFQHSGEYVCCPLEEEGKIKNAPWRKKGRIKMWQTDKVEVAVETAHTLKGTNGVSRNGSEPKDYKPWTKLSPKHPNWSGQFRGAFLLAVASHGWEKGGIDQEGLNGWHLTGLTCPGFRF